MLSIRFKVSNARSCLEKTMARMGGGPFIVVPSCRRFAG
jgi:hypothetical protein